MLSTYMNMICMSAKIFLVKHGSTQTRVGIEANGGEKSQYLFCCELCGRRGGEGACNFSDCNTLLDIISIRHSEHGTLFCCYHINSMSLEWITSMICQHLPLLFYAVWSTYNSLLMVYQPWISNFNFKWNFFLFSPPPFPQIRGK